MDASPTAVTPATKLPAFRKPQRAILAAKPPTGDGWIYELKYDGYRCLAAIAGREVKLYTRRGLNWTKQFGFVVPELRQLTKGSLLLDGEIVAFDAKGKPSFSELQAALGSGGPITYIAFDLLEQDGKDLIRLPQVKRKALLEAALGPRPPTSHLQYAAHLDTSEHSAAVMLAAVCKAGLEGIVAKRANAHYRADQNKAWLKIKCKQRQEFVIIGYRGPPYGVGLRSLIVGTYEDGKLVYRGRVGTGYTMRMLEDLYRKLKPIEIGSSRLEVIPKDAGKSPKWVKPQLVADVEFTEITPDGFIRHPSFKGLREDRDPKEVMLERPVELGGENG